MKHFGQKQSGYLTIIIVLIIITLASTSLVTSYIFSNKALSLNSSLSSMQSYYLAVSGIERAKYDISVNKMGCTAINGTANFTAATFPNAAGEFTTTGTSTKAASILTAIILPITTIIPLTSASGFAPSGSVIIDSETINYTGISGNNLVGAIRGSNATTAQTHLLGANVTQNQCVLNSIGAVPAIASPITQRVVQETILGTTFALGTSATGGIIEGALVVGGSTSLGYGAVVANPTVTSTNGNFSGSTLVTASTPVINGTGQTQISNGLGGLVTSSSALSIKGDILQNSPLASSASLFGRYFNASKAAIQASATQGYNGSNINGATGKLIWTSDLSINSPTTIGSAASPVVLIISGNLNANANLTVYGFVYATGSVALNGISTINGSLALEGAFNSNGLVTINYNPGLLGMAGGLTPNSLTTYSTNASNNQEIFA